MAANGGSLAGKSIEGYRIGRVLGTGSTSTVYEGLPLPSSTSAKGDQQPVAIKILTLNDPSASEDHAAFRRRFLREARAARKLHHPHILPVLSYGEIDGLTYMVMRLVNSGTLAAWLAAQPGPVPLADAADFIAQTADALDYAHKQGVIHRDIKPSNLLLDADSTVYLTDFGIARLFDSGGDALTKVYTMDQGTLTQTGEVLGTPYYMAPEQIKSEPISPATDVYALGIVLYLLVTGQVPFQGETPLAVALQHLQDDPCPPRLLRSELPLAAEEAILRALAKQPDDRFASAGELAAAFAAGLEAGEVEDAGAHTRAGSSTLAASLAGLSIDPATPYQTMVGSTLGDYQLEELLEVGELGPVFAARTSPTSPRYRLRALPLPDAPAETRSTYLGRFQQEAHDVSELEHPGILALLDYGCYHGTPYLVSPLPAGQQLAAILASTGPLDPVVADRYLAQLASAVDSAHQQGTVHGSLSPENIFVSKKGELTVADFGVRHMLDLGEPEGSQPALYYDREAASPEQLLGKPLEPASDVYAVGALLYQMLAGRPVFTGDTLDDIAQQHLHASPPPLRRWRAGMPTAFENILARALAKEPGQRYSRVTELADAYHQILTQASANAASPGGRTGKSLAGKSLSARVPTPARTPAASASTPILPRRDALLDADASDTQVAHVGDPGSNAGIVAASLEAAPATGPRASAPRTADASRATPLTATSTPSPRARKDDTSTPSDPVAPTARDRGPAAAPSVSPRREGRGERSPGAGGGDRFFARRRIPFLAGVALVAILALAVGLIHFLAPTASASITFSDASGSQPGITDMASVSATDLSAPPSGESYYAWLLNDSNETSQRLGQLVKQGNDYVTTFSGVSNGHPGPNLLGQGYDRIEITEEQGSAQVKWPAGKAVLVASVPKNAFVHVGHLLVAFPTTPNQEGLLVGLLDQAQVLNAQVQALQVAVKNQNTAANPCYAQSIIDIVEGSAGPSYAPLPDGCGALGITETGDGFGIIGRNGYTAGVSDHANLAANSPDATDQLKTQAGLVELSVNDVDNWLNDANHAAWWLLHHPDDTSGVAKLVADLDSTYHGYDKNGNGQIEAVPGEAGAQTAYLHGQLMATLPLVPTK
jgi:serine/threonine protein kinase